MPLVLVLQNKQISIIIKYQSYSIVYSFFILIAINEFYQYIQFKNRYIIGFSELELITYNSRSIKISTHDLIKIKKKPDYFFNIFMNSKSNIAFYDILEKDLEAVVIYVGKKRYYINPFFFGDAEEIKLFLDQFPIKEDSEHWNL